MLLKTGIELELLHDVELYNMVEKGLGGGMCQVSMRKATANNKRMGDAYDETKSSSYINYLDANNLYELAMCKKQPYKKIRFVKDISQKKTLNIITVNIATKDIL